MDSTKRHGFSRRSLVGGAGAASALALAGSSRSVGAQATPYQVVPPPSPTDFGIRRRRRRSSPRSRPSRPIFPKSLSNRRLCRGQTTGRSCKRPSPAARPSTSFGSTPPVSPSMPRKCLAADRLDHRRRRHRPEHLPRSAGRDVSIRGRAVRPAARFRHDRALLQQGPFRRRRSEVPGRHLDLGDFSRRR